VQDGGVLWPVWWGMLWTCCIEGMTRDNNNLKTCKREALKNDCELGTREDLD